MIAVFVLENGDVERRPLHKDIAFYQEAIPSTVEAVCWPPAELLSPPVTFSARTYQKRIYLFDQYTPVYCAEGWDAREVRQVKVMTERAFNEMGYREVRRGMASYLTRAFALAARLDDLRVLDQWEGRASWSLREQHEGKERQGLVKACARWIVAFRPEWLSAAERVRARC